MLINGYYNLRVTYLERFENILSGREALVVRHVEFHLINECFLSLVVEEFLLPICLVIRKRSMFNV